MKTLLLLALFCPLFAAESLSGLLPSDNDVPGWSRTTDYSGSSCTHGEVADSLSLNVLIDGDDVLYTRHGFQRAVYQGYSNGTINEVCVAIFDQGSGQNAMGLYHDPDKMTGSLIRLDTIGDSSRFKETIVVYTVEFVRGPYYAVLTIALDDAALAAGLKIAGLIDDRISIGVEQGALFLTAPAGSLSAFPAPFTTGCLFSYQGADRRGPSALPCRIYDTRGRLLTAVALEKNSASGYTALWDGSVAGGRAAPGCYLAVVRENGRTAPLRFMMGR